MRELVEALGTGWQGEVEQADDVVTVVPGGTADVSVALRLARTHGVDLIEPGADREGDARLDLRHLDEVVVVDDMSRLVHVRAGCTLGTIEAALKDRRLTLGTDGAPLDEPVGRWLARGAPGARDHADDPVDQLVAGLTLVLPDGRELDIRPAPRRAVGPDLISAAIGARGALGVITAAHLVARPRQASHTVAFRFPDREAAESARAWIRGRGVRPAHTRIGDTAEGPVLRVTVEADGALAEECLAVIRRTAEQRDGAEVAPPDLPPPPPVPPSPILDDLRRRLIGDGQARRPTG